MILAKDESVELAIWLAAVAEQYNQPILSIVNRFKQAADAHKSIVLAKQQLILDLSNKIE